jgi:hypothetical protein
MPTEMDIIHNYAREREILTLDFILSIVNVYGNDVEKIKEVILERIEKVKEEIK